MGKQDLLDAHSRIMPHTHRTPVLVSRSIERNLPCSLFFKCENFQRAGSYKIRGATNAILGIPEIQRAKGVVTHSSGNFAQALALAAKNLAYRPYRNAIQCSRGQKGGGRGIWRQYIHLRPKS